MTPEKQMELNERLAEARRDMEAEARLAAESDADMEARLVKYEANIRAELEADMAKRLDALWNEWMEGGEA